MTVFSANVGFQLKEKKKMRAGGQNVCEEFRGGVVKRWDYLLVLLLRLLLIFTIFRECGLI